nr:MAG: major capsid protein [Microvirus sp.]
MKRNKFNLSNFKLATFNLGQLVPVGLTEVLPGDSIQQATTALIRTSPLNAPVMHPTHVSIQHYFVPHRLVWNDWENFITGGPDGLNASTFPTYTINSGSGFAVGSLGDYLGVPTGVDDLPVSALPFRGYSLIWNEYFRDEQLQTALTIDKTDGADTTTNVTLQNVCWEKDYFTTSRPFAQLGTEVTLPLGSTAPVKTNATALVTGAQEPMLLSRFDTGGSPSADYTLGVQAGTGQNRAINDSPTLTAERYYPNNLYADLATATAASVNTIREAFALQRYKEARSRYGARYTEYLRYLGIKSSDARLQRPEYLGGGKNTLQFSEVLQTGVSTSGTPGTGVGILKGHGIGAMRSNRYRRFFEEHGYVFTLMFARPKTVYATGLPRHWSRTTKEDFYQKELEHIGQQEVLNKELYWADSGPNDVFGYQDRYDEYRRSESSISGEFRSSLANFWHYARIFAGDVTLNASFVSSDPATRVYQSTSTNQLYCMIQNSIQARRLLSKFGNSFTA